jgi:uncharacterized membrane protein
MSPGTLYFSASEWLWPAAGVFLVALFLLVRGYRGGSATPGVRMMCAGLKALGITALLFCLLEPLWQTRRARPGANFFAILADNSQGLQIKDRNASQSRGDALRAMLQGPGSAWQARLDEDFQVRRYLFDARLQSTKDFAELDFDGRSTALGAALRTLAERYRGQPLAGILLLTDGNATDWGDGAPDLTGLPPIYPVVLGTDAPARDLALDQVAVNQTSFEDAPVTLTVDVTAEGYSGAAIMARVRKVAVDSSSRQSAPVNPVNAENAANIELAGGTRPKPTNAAPPGTSRTVAEQTQKAPRDGQKASFRFQFKPEQTGVSFYQVELAAKDEGVAGTTNETAEATLANNRRVVAVDRGRGPFRILYVSGRPNWEFKFLNRALAEDDQLQLVGLIRIAKREPKFEFRSRPGETSNPLFRGFGNQSKEDVEQYDQPVLVRLNTRDAHELRGGFPKAAEDLFTYHAVIVDDLEAEFFTHDQMALLQKFVSQRGGGFLMFGGMETFHEGRYNRTPIGDMLPIYLDRPPGEAPPQDYKFDLTREGWLQPWARLRPNETEERNRVQEMPEFQVLNRAREIKPGASVIASVSDEAGNTYPALIVQRFGHGRTGALTVGDLWRWGLRDEAKHRDMDKAWRQMMRWLVADVPGRVELTAEPKRGDPNQAVTLRVHARDKSYLPLDNATASIVVRQVGGEPHPSRESIGKPSAAAAASTAKEIRLIGEPSADQPGVYEATYIPREPGGYLAEATVRGADGVEAGRAEAGWTSDPAAEEFRSLRPNRALLELIARQTGGELVKAGDLDAFARSLPNRKAPITEAWTMPLWHQPALFLFALICFIAEWGLRRWKGMA